MASVNTSKNPLREVSQGLAAAAKKAAAYTLLVRGGYGYPASGVAYSRDLVLTADHVVEETATVMLPDGRSIGATVVGRDGPSGLALLKLEEPAATPAVIAPQPPEVGEMVLALARPTEEGVQASLGVVSIARGRYEGLPGMAIEEVMRADVAVFPGYSGGPLVDTEGRVVGVNAFGSRGGGGRAGVSLTIPVARAWEIAGRLKEQGSLKRGYLGIRSQSVEIPQSAQPAGEQRTGLLVMGIEKGSPAEAAGLLVGDILMSFASSPISDHEDLLRLLAAGTAGSPAALQVARAGKAATLTVTPADAALTGERVSGHPHPHHRRR